MLPDGFFLRIFPAGHETNIEHPPKHQGTYM